MREGTIQLVMRGYGDPDSISTDGADAGDVLAQLRSGRSARRNSPAAVTPAKSAPAPKKPAVVCMPMMRTGSDRPVRSTMSDRYAATADNVVASFLRSR